MTDDNRYEELIDDAPPADVEAEPTPEMTTLERIAAQFGDEVLETTNLRNEATASVSVKALHDVMEWLHGEGFVLLSDLTAWDDYPRSDPRFWVVYQLTNIQARESLRVKVGLPDKKPEVDSVVDIWQGANFLEREVYDLMGITFKNHPDLRRIMLPEEWEGHPLRRDYPNVYEEVQFTHNVDEINRRKPYATE